MELTDCRGRCILEIAATLDLNVANVDNTTTFRRPGYGEIIPDITLTSEAIVRYILDWRVIESYTGSVAREEASKRTTTSPSSRWSVAKLKQESSARTINRGKDIILGYASPVGTAEDTTMPLVRQACDTAMPRKENIHGKKTYVDW